MCLENTAVDDVIYMKYVIGDHYKVILTKCNIDPCWAISTTNSQETID